MARATRHPFDSQPGVVYVLVCPVTGEVRYIGSAVSPKRRFSQHMKMARAGSELLVHQWIRDLLSHGLKSQTQVVQVCKAGTLATSEEKWIAKFRKQGNDLLNMTAPDGSFAMLRAWAKRERQRGGRVYHPYDPAMLGSSEGR